MRDRPGVIGQLLPRLRLVQVHHAMAAQKFFQNFRSEAMNRTWPSLDA